MRLPGWIRSSALPLVLAAAVSFHTAPAAFAVTPTAAAPLLLAEQVTPVGPGLTLRSFDRLDPRGWVRVHVLTADLTNPALSADLLYPGSVAAAEPISRMAERAGAIAGVNGDFFDISGTKAPLSAAIAGGVMLKGPVTGWPNAAGVGEDQIGRLASMALQGVVALPAGPQPLAALNQHLPENGIGLFTSAWGATSRKGAVAWGNGVREVRVQNGAVVAVTDAAGDGLIPPDSYVLLGREAGADALAGLKVGDPVSVSYQPATDAPSPFRFAVGGQEVLVSGGQVMADLDDKEAHPRSAIGFAADGKRMFLVAVDGRQWHSRGMTVRELAELMHSLGAASALNLDGGGSTTLVARKPGEAKPGIVNSLSGSERSVPNGIGLFTTPGTGQLHGFAIGSRYPGEHMDRVFPGLHRTLTARGYDEVYGPVTTQGESWQVLSGEGGLLLGGGLFIAGEPGAARVQVAFGGVQAEREIRVLGPLDRVVTTPRSLSLEGGAATFTVTGYDAEGYAAPIEPANVSLSYDINLLTVTATQDGRFRVQPKASQGAALITATVAGKEAFLPVTLGLDDTVVTDLEEVSGWRFSTYPAAVQGSMGTAPGGWDLGLKLAYDFTGASGTRAAYLDTHLGLPGSPERLGIWVKGDGQGAWLRAVVADAAGKSYTLDLSRKVDWSDWRYLETKLPVGVSYPVTLTRIYPVETDAARQYKGELVFDRILVRTAPQVTVPEQPVRPDPLLTGEGEADWTFATLSHARMPGGSPDSAEANRTRAALRSIAAAKPDFLIVGGDFVQSAQPMDLVMAKRILEEELGGLPVFYLPGAGEVPTGSQFDYFELFFGPKRRVMDHKGVRFILLNSAAGTLRASDFAQLQWLKQALDEAADDEAIRSVVVVSNRGAATLQDEREGRLVEQWLSEFRDQAGGKGAVYIAGNAGTGAPSVRRMDGVPHVLTSPAGWTSFGVGEGGVEWLRASVPADN